jgi:hypothetical protein
MKKTLIGLAAGLLLLVAAVSFASAGSSSACGDPTCCPSSCPRK